MSIKLGHIPTKGRLYPEDKDIHRSDFERDRDRIIHSGAFRKLEYKTQVFINHEGDYYRTRLTHSLEVAQITRAICRRLELNETLGEAIALAHDLGHTPFGHAGEEALHECSKDYAGFDHNAQSIRILTLLEQRYASFDGINLTWEVLEGIAKHNGPLMEDQCHITLIEYNQKHNLELDTFPSVEAQIASLADDIAYNAHDIDDGVRSKLITLDDLYYIPYIGESLYEIKLNYPNIEHKRLVHEFLSRFITSMIDNVINTTKQNIDDFGIRSQEEVRHLGQPLVSFSAEFIQVNQMIKSFLATNLYNQYKVLRVKVKTKKIVKDLFEYFNEYPQCLPPEWYKKVERTSSQENKIIVVCDFIAGMTDRFAIQEHQNLIGGSY